jgi:hypothetical protein
LVLPQGSPATDNVLQNSWLANTLQLDMRREMKLALAIVTGGLSLSASAQGTFQDLDFEEAKIVPDGGGYGYLSAADAFPGWQLALNGSPLSDSNFSLDGLSLGGAEISLIDNNTGFPYYSPGAIQGNYSAILFSGGLSPNLYSASISQMGIVPEGTQSIQFDVGEITGGPPFVVTLGGTPIEMTPLKAFVNYELWGGNIPPLMAGQSENLTINETIPTGPPPASLELDNITFSPTAVIAEPDPLILTTVGGVLFALYRRFAPKIQ